MTPRATECPVCKGTGRVPFDCTGDPLDDDEMPVCECVEEERE